MEIKKLEHNFTVCKVTDLSAVNMKDEFFFIGKTDEEVSLVCITEHVPDHTTEREDGWKGFRMQGVLDFSLVGILSKLSSLLAEHGISIFAISTYNTDYILVKKNSFDRAAEIFETAGYHVNTWRGIFEPSENTCLDT